MAAGAWRAAPLLPVRRIRGNGRTAPELPALNETDQILDLRGLKCPLPALRTRAALVRMASGRTLRVTCTDPLATIDVPHAAHETGDEVLSVRADDGVVTIRLRRRGTAG